MANIEQIKNKFMRGEAEGVELQQLLEWMKQSPANRSELFNEKDIWDTAGLLRNTHKYKIENELIQLNRSINTKKKMRFPNWLKIAAMFVIAICIGWLIRGQMSNPVKISGSNELKEIVVPKGQMSQIFLTDGTHIWLNSDTKILLPPVFVGNERLVTLEGEAFFEVAKDKKRPFVVKTEGQVIKVLGTSFNVRAYRGNIIQTTLNEGKIKLCTAKQEAILSPNEQSVVNRSTGKLCVRKVNTNFYDSWKEGRYEFVNENLVEVFKLVERWYDVDLIYNAGEFSDMYFSGVIRRDKPVSHFLQLLDLTIPIDYKMNGDKISIKKMD